MILRFQKSNRPGQPDPLKIKTLREKEEHMEKNISTTQIKPSSQPTLSFQALMAGVWEVGLQGGLYFDPSFRDSRQGYITFGKSALVLYLQQGLQPGFNWHCRIDISHAAIEHVIPAIDELRRGIITFTLKSPPKFYDIQSTDDLHLYSGNEMPNGSNLLPDMSRLTLRPKGNRHRLDRLCALSSSHAKSSALCMVYRVMFPDLRTAEHAFNFVKDYSVSEKYCWKTLTPVVRSNMIEAENAIVESILSNYHSSVPSEFDFAVRFQLTALVLEGTITPLKMIGLIPLVQELAKVHGAELTAVAVRHLGRQIPTPGPSQDVKSFQLKTFAETIQGSVEDVQNQTAAHQMLTGRRKKHQHLALTYKATVTPTGTRRRLVSLFYAFTTY